MSDALRFSKNLIIFTIAYNLAEGIFALYFGIGENSTTLLSFGLDSFIEKGFPNKKDENWKFSDLNFIISNNFKNIINNDNYKFDEKIESISDFDHNKIILINGSLKSYDLQFEESEKVKIESLKSFESPYDQIKNNLHYLNKALSISDINLICLLIAFISTLLSI